MPYFLDGDCVKKGTKEDPGETVKCHEDHAAAANGYITITLAQTYPVSFTL